MPTKNYLALFDTPIYTFFVWISTLVELEKYARDELPSVMSYLRARTLCLSRTLKDFAPSRSESNSHVTKQGLQYVETGRDEARALFQN